MLVLLYKQIMVVLAFGKDLNLPFSCCLILIHEFRNFESDLKLEWLD